MAREVLLSVRGVSAVPVAPGLGDEVRMLWPFTCRVTGLLALPGSGLVADAAMLSLSVVDGGQEALVSDGRTGILFAPFLALSGREWRWFQMNAFPERGEPWTFQIRNDAAGPGSLTPNVLLRLEVE